TVPGAAAARTGPNPQGPDSDSAAARAARIGRAARGGLSAEDFAGDEAEGRGRRRIIFVSATVVVLIVVGAVAGWAWVKNQYYVGVHDNKVAIFQGVQSLGALSSVHQTFMPISEVAEPDR